MSLELLNKTDVSVVQPEAKTIMITEASVFAIVFIFYFTICGSCHTWPLCASKSSAATGPHEPAA